jgi:two-component system, chemotaxis family, chemotaxis protein CheY
VTVKIRTRKKSGEATQPDAAEKFNVDRGQKIMILLEDSAPNRNILKAILSKLGFGVLVGDTGKVGMQHLELCQKEKLNLVCFISDIMMPEMDGLTFLEKVRADARYKEIPFLLVTAAADKDNVIEAGKMGVTGYLLKPVTMEQIRGKLQEIFPEMEFPSIKQMQRAS